jgi:hypothetical protein
MCKSAKYKIWHYPQVLHTQHDIYKVRLKIVGRLSLSLSLSDFLLKTHESLVELQKC